MFTSYQSMTIQLTLRHCGVAPLVRGQDGAAPGPVPGRGPPFATDCDSDSLAMARGEQSRTTGHLLRIAHWNAEGVRQKKLEFEQFLQKHNIDICCLQLTVPSASTCEGMKNKEMTEKVTQKRSRHSCQKQNTICKNIQIPRRWHRICRC